MAGQAQDDNSEEELDGANAKGDDFEHAWRGKSHDEKVAVGVRAVTSNRL